MKSAEIASLCQGWISRLKEARPIAPEERHQLQLLLTCVGKRAEQTNKLVADVAESDQLPGFFVLVVIASTDRECVRYVRANLEKAGWSEPIHEALEPGEGFYLNYIIEKPQ